MRTKATANHRIHRIPVAAGCIRAAPGLVLFVTATPRGVLTYRAAGEESILTVLDVVDELWPPAR